MSQRMTPGEAARVGLDILHFNNSLVQFADQKAATLIVINSIFIASAGSTTGPLQIAFLACAAMSLILCLGVVVARRDPPDAAGRSLVFYGDILRHKSPHGYLATLMAQTPDAFAEGVAASVYRTCAIADRKYRCYAWALRLTILAAPLWLLSILLR